MTNALTLQPKRGHQRTLSLKRSLTTVSGASGEGLFGKHPSRRTGGHSRGLSITKRATILDLLATSGSSEDEDDEDGEMDAAHLQSPTQNRTSLKRHVSMMTFSSRGLAPAPLDPQQGEYERVPLPMASAETSSTTLRTNSVLDRCGFAFTSTSNNIPTIGVDTFQSIVQEYEMRVDRFCSDLFTKLVVVDCRFPFEFEGGHIDGAVNITSVNELEDLFFNDTTAVLTPQEFTQRQRTLVVFHCEFSSMRGPLRASQLRALDRQHSGNDGYPNLYYPDVVVLEGGYKHYFESLPEGTRGYIEMDHPRYEKERERGLTLLRQESRTSLRR